MNNCPNCAGELNINDRFCACCGSVVQVATNQGIGNNSSTQSYDPYGIGTNNGQSGSFGSMAQPNQGDIAVRSGALMYQTILAFIFVPISVGLTLIWLLNGDILMTLVFLPLDFISFGFSLYFVVSLVRTPKTRIFYDGRNLRVNVTRGEPLIIDPREITAIDNRRNSGLMVGVFFIQDGKVIIHSRGGVIVLRHIRRVQETCYLLEEIRRYHSVM